jgi:hypothetical protein
MVIKTDSGRDNAELNVPTAIDLQLTIQNINQTTFSSCSSPMPMVGRSILDYHAIQRILAGCTGHVLVIYSGDPTASISPTVLQQLHCSRTTF